MVTAKLTYRDYVPYDTWAIEFTELEFYCGNDKVKTELDDLRHLLKFKQYDEQEALKEIWQQYRSEYTKKLSSLKKEVEELKKQYKLGTHIFLAREKFKSLKLKIKKAIEDISVIDEIYQSLKEDEYYTVHEEKRIFKDMLAELSFSCKSTHHQTSNIISIETYECLLSDEKLLELTQKCYKIKEEELNKDIEYIKNEFKREVENKLEKQVGSEFSL